MDNSRTESRVYEAQLELSGNQPDQMILISAVDASADDIRGGRRVRYLLQATPDLREQLFMGKWVVVYFRGQIVGNEVVMEEFVRMEDWK
jgi:hypothetical protein